VPEILARARDRVAVVNFADTQNTYDSDKSSSC